MSPVNLAAAPDPATDHTPPELVLAGRVASAGASLRTNLLAALSVLDALYDALTAETREASGGVDITRIRSGAAS